MGLALRECEAIGVIIKALRLGSTIGPPQLNEYAVEPVAVEIITPSEKS